MTLRDEQSAPSGIGSGSRVPPLLAAMRPRQWVKNLLVFAAPGAAGVVFHPGPFLRCLGALGVFVMASAATYLANDVADREADRLHPKKRFRPIAAGEVSPQTALSVCVVLAIAALGCAAALSIVFCGVIATYFAITFAYSAWLKHVAVIELACVASGFVLRAVGGGAAVRVPVSPWFLLVTSFGALFVVAGKRTSELAVLGEDHAEHRLSLGEYPPSFLLLTRALAATVTVAAYCLWAFDRSSFGLAVTRFKPHHLVWFELSIIPFVLALLVVELAIEQGRGGEPEELALRDRKLQALALSWVLLLGVGIYS